MSTVLCISFSVQEANRLLKTSWYRRSMDSGKVYRPVAGVENVRGIVNAEVWLLPGYEKHPEWKEMWIYLSRPGNLLTRKGGNLDV